MGSWFAAVRIPRRDVGGGIDFTEWTRHGMLRHPRFLGLRDDKKPEDVLWERPAA